MKRTSLRVLALVMVLASASSACRSSQTPASATGDASPRRGGTLVLALWQEPSTLLPIYANQSVATVVLGTIVEGLTSTDATGNYVPVLARQVPTLANGGVRLAGDGKRMDVTYELLPDVRWSDGSPLTSGDVKFTWETIMRDSKVVSREGYDLIDSIDTPTPTTAVLHYRQIYGAYLTRFSGLIPRSLEQEADLSKSPYVRRPLGTGPFKVTEFSAGDHITVERNPYYRVKDRPYLDRIIFRSVPSREVAIAQLKAGEVDGMWNLLEAQAPDAEKAGLRLVATPSPTVERLELNLAKPGDPADPAVPHPVLGDRAVRRALNLATPKQQIIDKLLFGQAQVGTSPISQGWAAPKGLAQEGYDPALANRVLDDAGWVRGGDGIRVKNGARAALTIVSTSGDHVREQVEQILVDEWRRIGIDLAIKNQPSSVLLSGSWSGGDPRKRGSFDVVMYGSTPLIDPHQTINQRYTTSNIPTKANGGFGQNFTRFSNAAVDAAVAEAGATVDQARRAQLYATALRLLNDSIAIIWLYDRKSIDAFGTAVHGPSGSVWQGTTWNAGEWWIAK